uniref:CCHC-type domain-containing protein n=1 Tax=Tanacetum cinerariifolium TaxID=118510 RepID=A0A699J644_TANCI|nr:hypothetical protein [Tanacetum cinerariifolium]
MTTPRPTTYSATTPCAEVFTPFVIIFDSDDEITILLIRPTPPSLDHTSALYGYPLDYGNDSSDDDPSDAAKSLNTQSASTSVVHPSPNQSLSTSLVLASQLGKEIPMPLGYRETMTTTNQGMSFAELEQIVAEQIANAIETIAIYETKTCMTRESMSQTKRQKNKVAKNASNKRKWKAKCGNCKWFGHQTRDCRTLVLRAKQRPLVEKQKAKVTCYECGMPGHYKSDCPMWKFQNRVNKYWK